MKNNSTEAARKGAKERKLQRKYFTFRWERQDDKADALLRQHPCLSWDRLTPDGSVFIGPVRYWLEDLATRS